jgi:hypothetical protein
MTARVFAAAIGGLLLLGGSCAFGGTITPNLPSPPLDPSHTNGVTPPRTQLCKTVSTRECVNYQGNPPHCTNFQYVPRQVCS